MRTEDFARFAEIWAMPEVVTHIAGKPLAQGAVVGCVFAQCRSLADCRFRPMGGAAARERRYGRASRVLSLVRGLGDDFDPYPEAGWVLGPVRTGKGLGLEAAQAAHDWFDRVVAGRTVCMITPENTVSLRIAEALGYVACARLRSREDVVPDDAQRPACLSADRR